MLRPVADILREEGRQVLGLAVQNTLVQMLERETGIPSMTVARFLKRHAALLEGGDKAALAKARAEMRGTVVLLDEASMVGNSDKDKLVRLANLLELDRFAAIGDKKQLGAVDVGIGFAEAIFEHQLARLIGRDLQPLLRIRLGHLTLRRDLGWLAVLALVLAIAARDPQHRILGQSKCRLGTSWRFAFTVAQVQLGNTRGFSFRTAGIAKYLDLWVTRARIALTTGCPLPRRKRKLALARNDPLPCPIVVRCGWIGSVAPAA